MNLVGNEKANKILQKIVNNNQILHSYLFLGPEGIGKKLWAKKFATDILKRDLENNPDFAQIEPDGNSIKIEQIRTMQEKIAEKPIASQKKIYLIENSDKMTKEAQNCLLKTLEEPPEYVVILLIASNEMNLLTTIKSRCTKIQFEGITKEEIKEYIKQQNFKIDIEENIIEFSSGSIGKLLNLIENREHFEKIEKLVKCIEQKDTIYLLRNCKDIFLKEQIIEQLSYMNFLLYKKLQQEHQKIMSISKIISVIEQIKIRLLGNANYDMSIDYLMLKIGEEFNEEHSRS